MTECMRNKRFGCSGTQVDIAKQLEKDGVIFLLNDETGILLGPFTVTQEPGDLVKGAWYSSVETDGFSANIKVEWESLHELQNATEKIPFLKDTKNCGLTTLQTQELLAELNEAPLYQD
jgi:hypothetical protein